MTSKKIKKPALGRGLEAIFQDIPQDIHEDRNDISLKRAQTPVSYMDQSDFKAQSDRPTDPVLKTVSITRLQPGVFQPRQIFDEGALQDLAASIRMRGIIEPLIVRPLKGDLYEIVAGERRWRAAQMAHLHDVPVIIRILDDSEALEIALIENIQRADLSPMEEARAYTQLINQFQYTQDQLAGVLGRSRSYVTNMLRLLKLPETVQKRVETGDLTSGHARALIGCDRPDRLAEDIVRRGLTVRQTEKLVADLTRQDKPSRRSTRALPQRNIPEKDADTRALERSLLEALGLTVTVTHRETGGDVTIAYNTLDQLDDVCRRLQAPFPE